MCAGDMTLEQNTPNGQGPNHPGVDGWHNRHKCSSWEEIWKYMLEHTASKDEVPFIH